MLLLFDINATGINTIVTIVSIVCAVLSGIFTIRTSKIKRQVYTKIDAFDLISFYREFHSIYLEISNKIRTPDSNKGGRYNKQIEKLNTILRDFNRYESKLPEEHRKAIKTNIDTVLENTGKLWDATAKEDDIKRCKSRLDEIDRKLIEITDKMIKE